MKIDILTLFPKMFQGPFDESIIKRAQEKKLVEIKIHNLRSWATDKRGTVDDRPFGGGTGMIMMVEPISKALKALRSKVKSRAAGKAFGDARQRSKVILLSPRGKLLTQEKTKKLSGFDHLILICGHYEGVDERVSEHLVDEEISIGDYILTGGELPAMVLVDATIRLIPGVLEKPEATKSESFVCSNDLYHDSKQQLLEYPQYTRPENFKGWKVPEILLSGDHQKIEEWRAKKSLEKTKKVRPDLLK